MQYKELLWLVFFKIILDIAIYVYVLPIYSYEPYLNYGEPDLKRMSISYVLLLFCWATVRPVLNDKYPVSRIVLIVQIMIIVIPFLSLSAQSGRDFLDVFYVVLPISFIALCVRLFPRLKIPQPGRLLAFTITSVCFAILFYVVFSLILKGGLSRLNFNFYLVYEYRELLRDYGFPLSGYFLSWSAYIINMALLVYGFVRRKYFIFIFAFLLQLLIFGMTNFKAYLFLPFVIIGFIILVNRMNFVLTILVGAAVVTLLLLVVSFFGEPMGIGLVRRIMVVPAAMHSLYFDYFSTHPNGLMSGSRWAELFNAPYAESIIRIVAHQYWGRDFSPNVSWLGDAYGNFGLIGIIFMSVSLAFILKLGDSLARQVSYKGALESLFIGVSISLCSSGLTTVLLTHGGVIALIVVWVLSYYLNNKKHL